jgi:hypothetical protein
MDDRYPDHPVVAGLTDGAYRLWTTSIAYCSQHLTDGLVPEPIITRWGVRHADRAASELVSAGLWRSSADGYEVVNYLRYQRSRSEVEDLSAKRSESGKKGAKAKQLARQTSGNVEAESESRGSESETSSSSDDDDPVAREWATLRLAQRISDIGPVSDDDAWLKRAANNLSIGRASDIAQARSHFRDATAAQLARYLFDGTKPPRPPRVFTHECGDELVGLEAYQDHLTECDFIPADALPVGSSSEGPR